MSEVDLQPDTEEIIQEQPPLSVIPVRVRGPVGTHGLPNEPGGARTILIGSSGAPKMLLGADHFRALAVLTSFDQDFLFGWTENQASDPSTMYRQPKNVPLRITASGQVWVLSATATTTLSYFTERWASSE